MTRLCLIHWHPDAGTARAAELRALGYAVDFEIPDTPGFLRRLRARPPDLFVIDLTRLPSRGRDMGLALRQSVATRPVPLVFADGDPAKVGRIGELLPDAFFAGWDDMAATLKQALAEPPESPVVPSSALAGYSGTPLPKKLRIKEHTNVRLLAPPAGFRRTLGGLPAGATVTEAAADQPDLVIWFVRSDRHLQAGLAQVLPLAAQAPVWIAWPKKGSALAADLTQVRVRATALAAGLVDYKICAIDETWSGLLFTRRSADR